MIRIREDNKTIAVRTEKADNPREACEKAYGVIYDKPTDTAQYVEIGTRSPRTLSNKKLNELTEEKNWKKIPQTS